MFPKPLHFFSKSALTVLGPKYFRTYLLKMLYSSSDACPAPQNFDGPGAVCRRYSILDSNGWCSRAVASQMWVRNATILMIGSYLYFGQAFILGEVAERLTHIDARFVCSCMSLNIYDSLILKVRL